MLEAKLYGPSLSQLQIGNSQPKAGTVDDSTVARWVQLQRANLLKELLPSNSKLKISSLLKYQLLYLVKVNLKILTQVVNEI